MRFQVRLTSLWKHITLSTILSMTLMFSVIILTHARWYPLVYGFSAFGAIFISMVASAFLCSRIHTIEISQGIISVDVVKKIYIDSIDWYYHDKNFLFDGIRIKTKENKNYYFTTPSFIKKDSNFDAFKEMLMNKSTESKIPIKTGNDLVKDSKFLRYGSAVFLIFYLVVVLLTLFSDFKIDTVKLIYTGMIAVGTFIATRK